MPHATLIVFIFSLAAGLGGLSLFHQLYARHGRSYLRAGLVQLLMFNLIVVVQLLFSYYELNLVGAGNLPSRAVTGAYLLLSSLLKLGWILSLILMAASLLRLESWLRFSLKRIAIAAGLLLISGITASRIQVEGPLALLYICRMLVEYVVLAGVLGVCTLLLRRPGDRPDKESDRLSRDFGLLLLAIWLPVTLSVLIGGWLWPGSEELRLLLHALLILGFNLAPWLLFRKRLPRLAPCGPGGEPDWGALAGDYGVTSREQEVLELICRGRTNQEIADTLFVSLQTVKDHNYRIFRKLGVRNRMQAGNLVRGHRRV